MHAVGLTQDPGRPDHRARPAVHRPVRPVQLRRPHLQPGLRPRAGLAGPRCSACCSASAGRPASGRRSAPCSCSGTTSGTALRGGVLAFVYALGIGIPFLIVALAFQRGVNVFGFARRHARLITRIGGRDADRRGRAGGHRRLGRCDHLAAGALAAAATTRPSSARRPVQEATAQAGRVRQAAAPALGAPPARRRPTRPVSYRMTPRGRGRQAADGASGAQVVRRVADVGEARLAGRPADSAAQHQAVAGTAWAGLTSSRRRRRSAATPAEVSSIGRHGCWSR